MTMYYTSEEHEKTYKALVQKYHVEKSNEYKALFYLLSASPDIRWSLADCIEECGSSILVKEDALSHGWVTGGDARLIRLAFNLFNFGVPTAIGLEGEALEDELRNCTPSHIFSGLDNNFFSAAITGLRIWARDI